MLSSLWPVELKTHHALAYRGLFSKSSPQGVLCSDWLGLSEA